MLKVYLKSLVSKFVIIFSLNILDKIILIILNENIPKSDILWSHFLISANHKEQLILFSNTYKYENQ